VGRAKELCLGRLTNDKSVFRKLFHETPWGCRVHVEVEGVGGEDEGEQCY
jgi:hypothetical protein